MGKLAERPVAVVSVVSGRSIRRNQIEETSHVLLVSDPFGRYRWELHL